MLTSGFVVKSPYRYTTAATECYTLEVPSIVVLSLSLIKTSSKEMLIVVGIVKSIDSITVGSYGECYILTVPSVLD